MMARWIAADLKRKKRRVPDEVDALLAPEFESRPQVPIMWAALADCYPSEAEAIAAAKRYPSLILPYMNSPSNVAGCYSVLVDLLGVPGAREVCIKNPAVLGNDPASLKGCTAKDIQDTANLREFVDTKLPFGLQFWARGFAIVVVAAIAAAVLPGASEAAAPPPLSPGEAAVAAGGVLGTGDARTEQAVVVAAVVTHWLLWGLASQRVALASDALCFVHKSSRCRGKNKPRSLARGRLGAQLVYLVIWGATYERHTADTPYTKTEKSELHVSTRRGSGCILHALA